MSKKCIFHLPFAIWHRFFTSELTFAVLKPHPPHIYTQRSSGTAGLEAISLGWVEKSKTANE